jgi:hypothetical protein
VRRAARLSCRRCLRCLRGLRASMTVGALTLNTVE